MLLVCGSTARDLARVDALGRWLANAHVPSTPSRSLRFLYGLQASGIEWSKQSTAAILTTWAADISAGNLIITGGPYDPSGARPCDDRDVECKEALMLYRARDRMRLSGAEWFLVFRDDAYVFRDAVERSVAKASSDAVVLVPGFGCGRSWQYDPRSLNGSMPRPSGWVERPAPGVCEMVLTHGAICSSSGFLINRAALEQLVANRSLPAFLSNWSAAWPTPSGTDRKFTRACDITMSCNLYERGIAIRGPPSAISAVDFNHVDTTTAHFDPQRFGSVHIATAHKELLPLAMRTFHAAITGMRLPGRKQLDSGAAPARRSRRRRRRPVRLRTRTAPAVGARKHQTGPRRPRVDPAYLEHLRSLPPIPRKIHLIWPDKSVIDRYSDLAMVRHGLLALRDLNPRWELTVYEYLDIGRYINRTTLLTAADRQILQGAHIVEQTDAFRFLVMYEQGGYYQDVDKVYTRPLDDLIQPQTRMLLPTSNDVNFANDIMCTSPGNRAFLHAIRRSSPIRREIPRVGGWARSSDMMRLGPGQWHEAISREVFGVDAIKGPEMVSAAREALQRTSAPTILTAKEIWCRGILTDDFPGCKRVSRKPLYVAYAIKPWAAAVDKRWADASSGSETREAGTQAARR